MGSRWSAKLGRIGVVVGLLLTAMPPAGANDGQLLWQKMSAKHFAIFQRYARLMMTADAAHQSPLLALWAVRKLPLNEYLIKIGSADIDPSLASAGLILLQGQLAAGEGNQLDGQSAMDLDFQLKAVAELPSLDAGVPSIDIYVSDQPLADIGRIAVQHEDGLQRQVARRGYGCQMARWLRGAEIVKAVGFLHAGADTVPPGSILTPIGMNVLCADRIALYGLGLDFLPAGADPLGAQSIMTAYEPRDSVVADYATDQPLVELIYRSGIKPGTPKADVVKLIDGLKLQ